MFDFAIAALCKINGCSHKKLLLSFAYFCFQFIISDQANAGGACFTIKKYGRKLLCSDIVFSDIPQTQQIEQDGKKHRVMDQYGGIHCKIRNC